MKISLPSVLSRSRVLTAGTATRVSATAFVSASNQDALLSVALRHYAARVLADIERAIVCTRFHSIPQQLASRIRNNADRIGRDDFSFTHEAMASLLGVRRISRMVGRS
jgi:hypothetical protein